ncbi:hypothetical protein EP331_03025 [bacterium]|nr:MAG: hypothetical protein EP331_03025 [bacterium]
MKNKYILNALILLTFFNIAQAQVRVVAPSQNQSRPQPSPNRPTGAIFNDTLWFVNTIGPQFISLTGNQPTVPESIHHKELDSVIVINRSENLLWALSKTKIVTYNGKEFKKYPFAADSLVGYRWFYPISDDSLTISLVFYAGYSGSVRGGIQKEFVWVNGQLFDTYLRPKPKAIISSDKKKYTYEPYKVIITDSNNVRTVISPKNQAQRIEGAWLLPNNKLVFYQPKQGFSILGDSIETQIPFSFKNSRYFLPSALAVYSINNLLITHTIDEIAIYDGNSWFYETIPILVGAYFQHKDKILFLSDDELIFRSFSNK